MATRKKKSRVADLPLRYVDNEDGTFSFPGTLTLAGDGNTPVIVMHLRGFPNGMSMKKYPREADCEKASPGIVKAQNNCRGSLQLACTVTVDADGNREITLHPTSTQKVKIIGCTPAALRVLPSPPIPVTQKVKTK